MLLQIDPEWVKTAARPFDPPLTEKGEEQVRQRPRASGLPLPLAPQRWTLGGAGAAERLACLQARVVAEKLKPYNIQQVFISPFYRYAMLAWGVLRAGCSGPCSTLASIARNC